MQDNLLVYLFSVAEYLFFVLTVGFTVYNLLCGKTFCSVIEMAELAITFAKRESTVLTSMDHPNITKGWQYSETEKLYCIYMEYAGFGSDYLSRRVLGKNKPVNDEKMVIWA